ncbi:MAG: hypothetical protein U5N85_20430 [Arcicella sp.]|nr:hypothetical protein [Arcicella sp.]
MTSSPHPSMAPSTSFGHVDSILTHGTATADPTPDRPFPAFREQDVSPLESYCRNRYIAIANIPANSAPLSMASDELSAGVLSSPWLWPEFHRRRDTPYTHLTPYSPLLREVQSVMARKFPGVDNNFMTGYVSRFITIGMLNYAAFAAMMVDTSAVDVALANLTPIIEEAEIFVVLHVGVGAAKRCGLPPAAQKKVADSLIGTVGGGSAIGKAMVETMFPGTAARARPSARKRRMFKNLRVIVSRGSGGGVANAVRQGVAPPLGGLSRNQGKRGSKKLNKKNVAASRVDASKVGSAPVVVANIEAGVDRRDDFGVVFVCCKGEPACRALCDRLAS